MSSSRCIATGLIALGLMGCADNPTEGQLWGTGAGGCPGAVAGSLGGATAAGVATSILKFASYGGVVGYYAGGALGFLVSDRYDPETRRMWTRATVEAAETGKQNQPTAWESPNHQGRVTPISDASFEAAHPGCRGLRQEASGKNGENPYRRDVVACRVAPTEWMVAEPTMDMGPPQDESVQIDLTLPSGNTVEVYPHPCRESSAKLERDPQALMGLSVHWK